MVPHDSAAFLRMEALGLNVGSSASAIRPGSGGSCRAWRLTVAGARRRRYAPDLEHTLADLHVPQRRPGVAHKIGHSARVLRLVEVGLTSPTFSAKRTASSLWPC